MDIVLKGNTAGAKYSAENKSVAIVVDTLRASTTIPVTMNQGIEDIFVVKEVSDVRLSAKENDTLLMGERGCIMLKGFDYGNSPTEMTNVVSFSKDKISFTSSTGARIVIESIGSECILIGSPINAEAVVSKIEKLVEAENIKTNQIVIIPAYSTGSIISNEITEDQIGGLIIANEFRKKGYVIKKQIDEEIIYLNNLLKSKSLDNLFLETKHGQKLLDLNLRADIKFCSQLNQINIAPISYNDVIYLSNGKKAVHFIKK